jgi:hypothetical protein
MNEDGSLCDPNGTSILGGMPSEVVLGEPGEELGTMDHIEALGASGLDAIEFQLVG